MIPIIMRGLLGFPLVNEINKNNVKYENAVK